MTLAELITRVEQGSGSDGELDAAICEALQYVHGCPTAKNVKALEKAWFGTQIEFERDCENSFREKWLSPPLTSSLDAVRALLKARLDEPWFQVIEDEHPNNRNPCAVFVSFKAEGFNFIEAEHHDIHRAFLSATLKAIAAKEGG